MMRLLASAALSFAFVVGVGTVSFESAAGASASWSSYLRTCVPVLVNQWTGDYNRLESALGTDSVPTITNADNVFGRLAAVELGSCTDSPDRTLNSEVQSLTAYQTVALLGVKDVLKGTAKANSVVAAIGQMITHEKIVGSRLANDGSIHG
jgi:hypothetical protein